MEVQACSLLHIVIIHRNLRSRYFSHMDPGLCVLFGPHISYNFMLKAEDETQSRYPNEIQRRTI
jgi:hypothetical protein